MKSIKKWIQHNLIMRQLDSIINVYGKEAKKHDYDKRYADLILMCTKIKLEEIKRFNNLK